jgi:transposase
VYLVQVGIIVTEKPYNFSEEVASRMEELLAKASNQQDYRRIQTIYFRARYGDSAEQIAARTGFAVQTVRNLHSAWQHQGEAMLQRKKRGGRRNQKMTLDEEKALLQTYQWQAEQGGILEVSKIHQDCESKTGKKFALSTTYRLLHRHGWRKIAPRPKHPKADVEAQHDFKKVAEHSDASQATR